VAIYNGKVIMPKRADSNQAEIVAALRDVGATVQHLHEVGKGCPDLLVGYRGFNYLLEVKDGKKPPSARELTKKEHKWHVEWKGNVQIVLNPEGALRAIGVI